jgi:hypothetical protein
MERIFKLIINDNLLDERYKKQHLDEHLCFWLEEGSGYKLEIIFCEEVKEDA